MSYSFKPCNHLSRPNPSPTSLLIQAPSFCMNNFVWVLPEKRKSGARQRNPMKDASKKYLRAARWVAAIHLFLTLFALLGGFLVIYARWIAWVHIPVAFWGSYAFLASKTCPLTPLEKRLRKKADAEVTEDGFVEGFMPFRGECSVPFL